MPDSIPLRGSAYHPAGGTRAGHHRIRALSAAELQADTGVTLLLRERVTGPTTAQSLAWLQSLPDARARHLDITQLTARHGFAASDRDRVVRWATASGLQLTFEDAATRRVMVRGSAEQLAAAFEVDLERFRWEQPDGRSVEYRGHTGPVHIPAHLGGVVEGVYGLDDRPVAHSHVRGLEDGRAAVFAYDPPEIAALYDYPRLPNGGEGVELVAAMIELGGVVHPFDLAASFARLGLPAPDITNVWLDGATPAPDPEGADVEVALDYQVIGGMVAPIQYGNRTLRGHQGASSPMIKRDGPARAGIYARISMDRGGEALGVARQEADCRAEIERRGWTLVGTWVDNDLSAYSGKPRPQYQAMLADLAAGRLDAVVTYNADRLYRRIQDLEAFVDAVNAAGALVVTTSGGDYDLSTADGRLFARMAGVVARHQSERSAERIRRKQEEHAGNGVPRGGGRRAFGFSPNGRAIVEAEAAIIREAAGQILSGERLRPVVNKLNAAGAKPARGERWSPHSLKSILTSPRIAGKLIRHGEVIGRASFGAIVSESDLERLQAILQPGRGAPRARLLLTGVLACPDGHSMGSGGRRGTSGGQYACAECKPTLTVSKPPLERHVTEQAMAHIGELETADAIREAQEADAEITDADVPDPEVDRKQLAELKAAWDRREIPMAEYLELAKPVRERIAAADRVSDQRNYGIAVQSLARRAHEWDQLSTDQQRQVLARLIKRVMIRRGPTGSRFDPGRVTIEWVR